MHGPSLTANGTLVMTPPPVVSIEVTVSAGLTSLTLWHCVYTVQMPMDASPADVLDQVVLYLLHLALVHSGGR